MSDEGTDITERDNRDINASEDNHRERPTLTEKDAKHLERLGLLKRIEDGWWKVSFDIMHATTYNAGRNESFGSFFPGWNELAKEIKLVVMQHCLDVNLMSLARTSKDTRSLADFIVKKRQEKFACIPVHRRSLEALKYLGFTDEKAAEIWDEYTQTPLRDRPEFSRHAVKRLHEYFDHIDALDDSNDWRAVMNYYGIRREFQDTILDPRFRDIRLTETASYWAGNTVLLRYLTLKSISRKSSIRAMTLMTPDLPGHYPTPKQTSYLQIIRNIKPKPAETLDGMTVLWKGTDVGTVDQIFPWSGQGFIDKMKRCKESTDFCDWDRESIIMYSSRLLAEKHARYLELRSYGHSPASLIKMSIPARVFDNPVNPKLNVKSLSHNDQVWKKIVWHSRRGSIVVYKNIGLVIGPISCNVGKAVFKMDDFEEMTEDNVFKFDEGDGNGLRPAMQYSFQPEKDGWDVLRKKARLENVVI